MGYLIASTINRGNLKPMHAEVFGKKIAGIHCHHYLHELTAQLFECNRYTANSRVYHLSTIALASLHVPEKF